MIKLAARCGLRAWTVNTGFTGELDFHRLQEAVCAFDVIGDRNSLPSACDALDEIVGPQRWRGVNVIRDPRDVLISSYFSHRNSHPDKFWPELQQHREVLQAVDKEAGIIADMEFTKGAIAAMAGWPERVATFRYEQMVADPKQWIADIVAALGWSVCREESDGVVDRLSFEHMTHGRPRGVEDQAHHYRKGVPGDWANHWTPAIDERFNAMFPDILNRTGYQ
jgi:hypothetical protein